MLPYSKRDTHRLTIALLCKMLTTLRHFLQKRQMPSSTILPLKISYLLKLVLELVLTTAIV